MFRISAILLLVVASTSSSWAAGCFLNLDPFAANLRSPDPAVARQATVTLREIGPRGLAACLDNYDKSPDPKMIPAIEAVAGERGAVVSRLYWYTDLQQAKSAAKAEQKPILYLRMMGKLTDEYSCANSRFFRTVLYANSDISKLLREQFVLVWVSERPVPVVTLDYGDGRILKRTLTGNSIHYILDSEGRVIDALPGLYAPKIFQAALTTAQSAMRAASRNDLVYRPYWARVDDGLIRTWQADSGLVQTGGDDLEVEVVNSAPAGARQRAPLAPAAMGRAFSKSAIEVPLLAQIDPGFGAKLAQSIDKADGRMWDKVAGGHLEESRLDALSISVIRSENPKMDAAALDRMVDHFQKLIALDTVHNNYQLRRQIIAWLRQSPGKLGVEELNQRVYSELFLTPRSDPWLGLVSEDYTGLMADGCYAASR